MTKIDLILIVCLALLLIVVVLRVWIGRRKQAKEAQVPSENPDNSATPNDEIHAEINTNPVESNQVVNKEQPIDDSINNDFSDLPGDLPNVESEENVEEEESLETFTLPSEGEVEDPIILIKTFSASTEKRLFAIKKAAEDKLVEAVPALIEALYEPDPAISSAAADSLGVIGDERAIEPLLEISRRNDAQIIKQINDREKRSEDTSQEVEETPGEQVNENPYNFKELTVFKIDQLPQEYFQADGSPIPRKDLVVKGLRDNNQQLRQMAAKAAIGIDSEEVIEPLIEVLANPFEVESVRFMAAEALGGMNDEKSIEPLLNSLGDENVAVRYSAAAALSGRKDERVVMALIGAIYDPDKYVRSSVAFALGTTEDPRAMAALFDCITDESDVVRFSAAKALGSFSPEKVIAEVKNRYELANLKTRLALTDVVGHLKCKEATDMLKVALKDENSEISYRASMALMGQESVDVIDDLIEASKRLDNELMSLMVDGVDVESFQSGQKEVQETGKAEVTGAVKSAVSKINPDNLPESLKNLFQNLQDGSHNIRISAVNALGDFSSVEAVDLLVSAKEDENEFVRAAVVASLGKIQQPVCIEILGQFLNDPSEEVRYSLVRSLEEINSDMATMFLEQIAAEDGSKSLRRTARVALEKKKG